MLTARMNRDYWAGVQSGMPNPRLSNDGRVVDPDRRREYTVADVQRALKTARFRALARAYKDEQAVAAKRAAREQREAQQSAERIEREIAAEKRAMPHLYALVLELQAEIAALRGR